MSLPVWQCWLFFSPLAENKHLEVITHIVQSAYVCKGIKFRCIHRSITQRLQQLQQKHQGTERWHRRGTSRSSVYPESPWPETQQGSHGPLGKKTKQRVREGCSGWGGGWHDILFIIREAVTFTRGSRRGAAPGAVQGFVMYVRKQERQNNGHILKFK